MVYPYANQGWQAPPPPPMRAPFQQGTNFIQNNGNGGYKGKNFNPNYNRNRYQNRNRNRNNYQNNNQNNNQNNRGEELVDDESNEQGGNVNKCYTCKPRGTVTDHIISETDNFTFHHDMFRRPFVIMTTKPHYHTCWDIPDEVQLQLFKDIKLFIDFWNIKKFYDYVQQWFMANSSSLPCKN